MPLSEFDIIEKYFAHLAPGRDDVLLGIGDDAALLQAAPDRELVATLDTMVAGVHFHPDAAAADVGYKLMAVNLSDLAAMGADPCWALLGLTLPGIDQAWLKDFAQGLAEAAGEFDVQLVGGDTARGPLTLSLQLSGQLPRGAALRRDGARAGDAIFVTGDLGAAALGLKIEQQVIRLQAVEEAAMLERLYRPRARVREGVQLRGIASACIDISDGLLADLGHVLDASACGASLELAALPMAEPVAAREDIDLALAGGEDYELCFCVPAEREAELQAITASWSCACSRIGVVESEPGLRARGADGESYSPPSRGYEHFKGDGDEA